MTCISCPIGCTLKVIGTTEKDLIVSGNKCSRGEVYANEEIFSPKRIVTTVARTESDELPCIPVKTDKPLVMQKIPELLKAIYATRVTLPAKTGQVILKNFDNTGVNVVITRSIDM
jgi:CxxC motif-containing protein